MNQNIQVPKKAMVLAAGIGTRMRPITDQMPKPLVRIYGKTLLDYGLDALESIGAKDVITNVHYLSTQIEEHVCERKHPNIIISDESDELMDSGGGVKKALPLLGDEPFFLLNADSFWLEGSKPNLELLAESWVPEEMDILLLLSGMTTAVGYDGKGDFSMSPEGQLIRRIEQEITPFAYAGAAIINPSVFADTPDTPFSLNLLFDRAIESGRLYGAQMDGVWLHVGTPEAISEAEKAIALSTN